MKASAARIGRSRVVMPSFTPKLTVLRKALSLTLLLTKNDVAQRGRLLTALKMKYGSPISAAKPLPITFIKGLDFFLNE